MNDPPLPSDIPGSPAAPTPPANATVNPAAEKRNQGPTAAPVAAVATAAAAPAANQPTAPTLKSLTALLPLLILGFLLGAWFKLHFDVLLGWFGTVPALGLAAMMSVWSRLLKDTQEGARMWFMKVLTSRSVTRSLWTALAVFIVISLFVSSAHVTRAEANTVVWITPIVPGAATTGTFVDSARLDSEHRSRTFPLLISPAGRALLLFSSDGKQTALRRALPWLPVNVIFPTDFDSVTTVALLPAATVLRDIRNGQSLQLIVRDAEGAIIADTTLKSVNAHLLSFRRPVTPDSLLKAAWFRTLQKELPEVATDTAVLTSVVNTWMPAEWVPAVRPIARNDVLDIALLRASGDTVAALQVHLTEVTSNVYLKKRR